MVNQKRILKQRYGKVVASYKIINEHIFQTSIWLTKEIPLYVYLVKGSDYGVFIDSGVKSMFPYLLNTVRKSGLVCADIKYILHTHSHHDHIGSNAQLKAATGCQVAAHKQYAHWHTDFEKHYREFALPFPQLIKDKPELRSEVLSALDEPHAVDLMVDEGSVFYLGSEVELEAFLFSGHMMAELGWYEKLTKTLILGDVITLMDAPFIHGHLTVKGYRESLNKINMLINKYPVEWVLMAHFPPSTPQIVTTLINQAYEYLDRLENTVTEIIENSGVVDLKTLWQSVCDKLGKVHEFRSLSTVHAHVEDLKTKNIIIENTDKTFSLKNHEKI